jgi:hypothetical protein
MDFRQVRLIVRVFRERENMRSKNLLILVVIFIPFMLAFAWTGTQMENSRNENSAFTDEVRRIEGLSVGSRGFNNPIVDQVSDSTLTEYITRLVDFQTRYVCTDSNWAAGQWIYDKFIEFGYTEVYFDSFSIDYPPVSCGVQQNIVAVKPGFIDPDRYVILGGHYDSVTDPQFCDPDSAAPGADDNASGTALTLEAARILAGEYNDITLVFIAFGAEEAGVLGSAHYAREAYESGMDIRVMMNADMVAYLADDIWDVDIYALSRSNLFYEAVEEIALTYTDLITYQRYSAGSDAHYFAELGYHTVYAFETDFNNNLHTCEDTVDKLSMPYFAEVTELFATSMIYFSNMPDQPTGFNAANVGDGSSLYLIWDPNDEPDLAGYNIYWGTQSGFHDSVKTVTTVSDTLQNLIDGQIYYLALGAIDTDDNESFLTEEIEITVSSRPAVPVGIVSTSLGDAVVIEWDPNSDLDLSGYNIFRRSVDGPPDSTLLGFIPEPSTIFSDQTAEPNTLYGYHVTALDSEVPPTESDPSEEVFGRLATHDMGVLVVDNTLDGPGWTFTPTDESVDLYYSDILSNYNVQAMWDVADSVAMSRAVMDYDLGIYSVVLWHNDVIGGYSQLSDTTAMRKYLDAGGNLWLSGWKLLAFLTGSSLTHYVFEGGGFIPDYVGVDSARTTSGSDQDFIGAEGLTVGFPTVGVDYDKLAHMNGLFEMEVLLPPFENADSLYSYISSDSTGSEYHGLPVGVEGGSTSYGLVFTDFPLYFMDQTDTELLVEAVMAMFGEPLGMGDKNVAHLPRTFSLSQNYPNPFNPSTTIEFTIPAGISVPAKIVIYDIRGRQVRNLVDREEEPGEYQVHWDGRDDHMQAVSSGAYLYRIEVGNFVSTRKMLLVR